MEQGLNCALPCRAIFELFAKTTGRAILAQYFAVTIEERNSISNTFEDPIQFLGMHLSSPVQAGILECHGSLCCQTNQQGLIFLCEAIWFRVSQEQSAANLLVTI